MTTSFVPLILQLPPNSTGHILGAGEVDFARGLVFVS